MFHADCISMGHGSSPDSSFICGSGSGLRAYHPTGEAKFTVIPVALRHLMAISSGLHDCCTLTSTANFCFLGKAPSQLFYSASQGIQ